MKVEEETVYVCKLTLNKKEAEILKGLVQNPIMQDEPQDITDFRGKLFNSITLGYTGIRGVDETAFAEARKV